MMKYKFEKQTFVRKNLLLVVQESEIIKIRDRFQKTINIKKQMRFDVITFREFFQFERITANFVTHDEVISFAIKQIIQRADSVSRKKQKNANSKHETAKKNVIEKIIEMIKHKKFERIKK